MPIYEYVCQSCRHRFEVKQSMADLPLSSCERCGKAVTKVISAPAIMFKGTGWYVTDYSDKLKPESEPKVEEKAPAAEKKKEGDSAAAAAPAAGSAAPAGSSSSTPAPATPSSSNTK